MKVLFVGLGSIGLRHLKNLWTICSEKEIPLEVVALRSTGRGLPPEIELLIDREVEVLPQGEYYDIAFITNPTSLHAISIGELRGRVNAFFIEKPIFHQPDYDLELLGLSREQKAYVAAPLRWSAVYLSLKEAIKGVDLYSSRIICSSYLPDWRKGVDYRNVYSAHKQMGGGVSLDLIHEWDYLCSLFGLPEKSFNLRGTYSNLEINSDDVSLYIASWPGMVGEVHLDYFGREPRREIELFCEEGSWFGDFIGGRLVDPDGSVKNCQEEPNFKYLREMSYFVNYALSGVGSSINSPRFALEVLKIALGGNDDKGE